MLSAPPGPQPHNRVRVQLFKAHCPAGGTGAPSPKALLLPHDRVSTKPSLDLEKRKPTPRVAPPLKGDPAWATPVPRSVGFDAGLEQTDLCSHQSRSLGRSWPGSLPMGSGPH